MTDPPANVEVDFERADQLYYHGDVEEAMTIYNAAAESESEAERQAGLWAIARIQAERGDNGAAERSVEALLESNPPEERSRQALLLLGVAEFAQADFEEAREAFEDYLARGGAAWPYAMLYLGQIDSVEEDPDAAIENINKALLAELPPATEHDALVELAEIHASAGDDSAAVVAYRKAIDAAPSGTAAAQDLWELAAAAKKADNQRAAEDAIEELIVYYPGYQQALDALSDDLVTANPAITTRERAIVLFRHQVNDEAEAAFRSIIDAGGAGAPEAHYYLGIISERYTLWEDAIISYDAAIAGLPLGSNDSLRAQAYWDKGTVLERLGRTDEAIAAYAAVSDADPAHRRASEGVFRAGIISYQAGRSGDAVKYWQRFLGVAPDGEERARAAYWLAEAYDALGDMNAAVAYREQAEAADPLDYYGLRATARLAGEMELPAPVVAEPVEPDWTRFEEWLAGWAGPEDAAAAGALFESETWLRAEELFEAGLGSRADDEFRFILDEHSAEPWLVYRILREMEGHGRPWVTSPAASMFLRADAPPEAMQLVYPLEFLDLVQEESEINGFSPLLLLSMIRQESLYDPGAVSIADALGLTQVIPTTAEGIALELGEDDFRLADLLRPRVSIRFGAYYLGSVLDGFDGTVPPALSGYNGGPGNAGRWWDASGGDPDVFLESIDFPETRSYVELVLENYARYLYAYGFVETPSLPLG